MKRVFALLVVPVAAATLAACGGEDSGSPAGGSVAATQSPAASAEQHNDQDVTFAQMMILHHRQAIEMAGQARTRAATAAVKRLAGDIEAAQNPEIRLLTAWLESWGETAPSGDMGHDMGAMEGHGMMSAQDMNKLEKLSGKRFDKAFLTMMIEHHRGAIAMAGTEQSKGRSAKAKDLAGNVVKTQSAEIAKMRKLLKRL